jgi:anti-sigma-K factor RskA
MPWVLKAMIDERTEEQAALYALDALEGDEKSAFEAELARNEELRRLVDDLQEASASLAHAAPPRVPPAELETRILDAISSESPPRSVTPRIVWLPWAAAAALALFCGLLMTQRAELSRQLAAAKDQIGSINAERDRAARLLAEKQREIADAQSAVERLRVEREELVQQVARWREREEALRVQNTTLAEQRTDLEKKVAELERLGTLSQLRVATLTSKLPSAPGAAATVVWDPEKQQGILKVANAPTLGADKDYQLWLVDPAYKQPVDGGVFSVDEKGTTEFTFRPKLRITSANAFAVSLERKGGVPKAEGPMVLVSN